MKKSISVNVKRRGRPATGQDPVSAVRLPADLTAEIDAWSEKHGSETRSEAIRRLVELGLTVKSTGRHSDAQKHRAREMAGKAIDGMNDAAAHADEQASRKRRLLKGPSAFREVRMDGAKRK